MSSSNASRSLPAPPPELRALSDELCLKIRNGIAVDGWLSFARYMDLALYTPRLGYYRNGLVRFGSAGDFVTAPELGPAFATTLARGVEAATAALGDDWTLMEIGAGSGRLALDLLPALARPPAAYLILESSGELRDRQRTALSALPAALRRRVDWLDAPPEQAFDGVILANEVLDALPVHRFRRTGGRDLALGVGLEDGRLNWQARPAEGRLAAALEALSLSLPEGYESEICIDLAPWLQTVTAPLARGVVYLIDYGYARREYYHPARSGGTLVCHYRHRAHFDPFAWPGLTDITAFVDFTAVAEAADLAGLEVLGYTTQGHWLLALGLLQCPPAGDDALAQARLANEIRRLTLPGEMGEKFKVMALGRGDLEPLPGFEFDQCHRL